MKPPFPQGAASGAFRYRYVILGVLTFCYTVQYVDRVQVNTLMPFISKSLALTPVQIGLGSTLMMLFDGPS